MPWDDTKATAQDPDNPDAGEQLTASEWNQHVVDGHFPSDELNLGVNGSGDPVITDPQNGDQEVMRYDRSAGEWVVSALSTGEATIGGRRALEQIDSDSGSGPLSVTNISGYDIYRIEYELYLDGTGDLWMRLNGDGASTGNYAYHDDTGDTTGADELVFASVDQDFAFVSGSADVPQRVSILGVEFGTTAQVGRVSAVAEYGHRAVSTDLSAVEIGFDGNGFRSGNVDSQIRVYGAVR